MSTLTVSDRVTLEKFLRMSGGYELNLVPETVPEAARGADMIKRLLSNLGTIGNGLAELRNLYGTGHGKHGSATGLSARHAKLAVGADSTLVVFLFETHSEQKQTSGAMGRMDFGGVLDG